MTGQGSSNNIDVNEANKRVIDQLNAQIDFLNDQLAAREDQVVKQDRMSHQLDAMQAEYSIL